jgi:hypothetical protein
MKGTVEYRLRYSYRRNHVYIYKIYYLMLEEVYTDE